jgi:hypothetical protein
VPHDALVPGQRTLPTGSVEVPQPGSAVVAVAEEMSPVRAERDCPRQVLVAAQHCAVATGEVHDMLCVGARVEPGTAETARVLRHHPADELDPLSCPLTALAACAGVMPGLSRR